MTGARATTPPARRSAVGVQRTNPSRSSLDAARRVSSRSRGRRLMAYTRSTASASARVAGQAVHGVGGDGDHRPTAQRAPARRRASRRRRRGQRSWLERHHARAAGEIGVHGGARLPAEGLAPERAPRRLRRGCRSPPPPSRHRRGRPPSRAAGPGTRRARRRLRRARGRGSWSRTSRSRPARSAVGM